MAFDFSSCNLVGPVNGRFGAAGLMVPPRVEDCPEREVLKGQFFAVRSKVEQENVRKKGFIAMARSLLNGFV